MTDKKDWDQGLGNRIKARFKPLIIEVSEQNLPFLHLILDLRLDSLYLSIQAFNSYKLIINFQVVPCIRKILIDLESTKSREIVLAE